MDNGLIFPYPRERAHAETGDVKRLALGDPSGDPG
jgi:hypothetical protein